MFYAPLLSLLGLLLITVSLNTFVWNSNVEVTPTENSNANDNTQTFTNTKNFQGYANDEATAHKKTPVLYNSSSSTIGTSSGTQSRSNNSLLENNSNDSNANIPPSNEQSPLGTNLNPIEDWSPELTFVDAFKTSRPWITHCTVEVQPDCMPENSWDTEEYDKLDLDENGWIRSLPAPEAAPTYWYVGTLLFRSLGKHYPAGQYIVLYDGEGQLEYGFAAHKDEAASRPGRDVLNVIPDDNGIYLKITKTDPNKTGNYIRNIRVIMPGFENSYQTQVFYPLFLQNIKYFKVLRFMDWMSTNGSDQDKWENRPQITHARWSNDEGAPLEVMVDLANRNHSDPWFTLPHKANNDYVLQFATMVKKRLDKGRKVYVEYSNEVWNSQFLQGDWVEEQANKEWPSQTHSGFTKRINWYGKRLAEICQIWKQVWGKDAGRVICAIGGQAENSWTTSEALDCPLWTNGAPCFRYGISAVAIAPYFGYYLGLPHYEKTVEAWTKDPDGGLNKLFQELHQGGLLPEAHPRGALQQSYDAIAENVSVSNARGLELIAYEGGQHLVGVSEVLNNDAITKLFISANRDPRMGSLYMEYLQTWKKLGGKLFTNFISCGQYSKWGSWGIIENFDQVTTPKQEAILNFIQANQLSVHSEQLSVNRDYSTATAATRSVNSVPATKKDSSKIQQLSATHGNLHKVSNDKRSPVMSDFSQSPTATAFTSSVTDKDKPAAGTVLWYLFTAYDFLYMLQVGDKAWHKTARNKTALKWLNKLREKLDNMVGFQDSDGGFHDKKMYKKSTPFTATVAALFANATRLSAAYDVNLASDYLGKAEKAWKFLQAHPQAAHPQATPATLWAAAELYRVTGDIRYHQYFEQWWTNHAHTRNWFEWEQDYKHAFWAYLQSKGQGREIRTKIFQKILREANRLVSQTSLYHARAFNDAFLLMQAGVLSGDNRYRKAAALRLKNALGSKSLSFNSIQRLGIAYLNYSQG